MPVDRSTARRTLRELRTRRVTGRLYSVAKSRVFVGRCKNAWLPARPSPHDTHALTGVSTPAATPPTTRTIVSRVSTSLPLAELHTQSVGGQVSDCAAGAAVTSSASSRTSWTLRRPCHLRVDRQTELQHRGPRRIITRGPSRSANCSHSIAAGTTCNEVSRQGSARDYSSTPFGTYTFAPGAPQAGEHPLTYSQTFGVVDLRYAQTQASTFVQDDIRVSPRVTASLGLRYEMQSITDARTNFGPRLGVVWDVAGSGRTVVRSGFGVFYDQYYMYLTRRYITLGPRSPQASYTWSWGDAGFPEFPNSLMSVPEGKLAGSRDIMIPGDRLLNPHSRQVR